MENSSTAVMDRELLRALGRAKLQKLAKEEGIKANAKTETIIDKLLEKYPSGVPQGKLKVAPAARRSIRTRKAVRRSEGRQVLESDAPKTHGEPTTSEDEKAAPIQQAVATRRAPIVTEEENARLMKISRILLGGMSNAYGLSLPAQPKPATPRSPLLGNHRPTQAAVPASTAIESVEEFAQGSSSALQVPTTRPPEPDTSVGSVIAEPATSPTSARFLESADAQTGMPSPGSPKIRGASYKGTRKILRSLAKMVDSEAMYDLEVEEQDHMLRAARDNVKRIESELDENQSLRLGLEDHFFRRFKHDGSLRDGSWAPPQQGLSGVRALPEQSADSAVRAANLPGAPADSDSSSRSNKRQRSETEDSSDSRPDKGKKRARP
ncbi:hypothetical protein OBBRIDRAFT_793841 [Obba rivulosa]|uniref:Uncharacterized protein n=1 Tax=Obba rivulosa TaxID=1052685 RepID=A0A8E2DIZ6_9APHY|nr:hypothetical protein OBBRIDRAFT_793841 [Obba rivulosa]